MTTEFLNPNMTRRAALTMMGSAGLGLAAMHVPAHADIPNTAALQKLLPSFSEKSRALIAQHLAGARIPADDVAALLKNEKLQAEGLIEALLPVARTYSRPPISNYLVGVVALGASGDIYFGANLEVPGQGLGFSVHGEQSALSNAYMHDEKSVSALAVTAAPCGHCRQFMYEMFPDGHLRILVAGKQPVELSTLLPAAFGPKDLGSKEGAFPVKHATLEFVKPSTDATALAALSAASKSYAPYSKSPSGVAISTTNGVASGSYIENVAFNPSLPPSQTALSMLVLSGGEFSQISRAVLVELQGATISQKTVAEATLSTIAPNIKLEVIKAKHA